MESCGVTGAIRGASSSPSGLRHPPVVYRCQSQRSLAGLAALLVIASTATAQRPLGIDVSFWQGTITQAQWNQVFASGRVFAFIKSTQGKLGTGDTGQRELRGR